MLRKLLLVLVTLCTVAFSATAFAENFGHFRATTIYGDLVSDRIFQRADLTLVYFWAVPHQSELQDEKDILPECDGLDSITEVANLYRGKGVQVVGIVANGVTESAETRTTELRLCQALVKKYKVTFTNILPSQEIYTGIMEKVNSAPTTYFVDRNGKIVGFSLLGAQNTADWVQIIDRRLAELKNKK